jgi:hypothetical protein
MIAPPQPNKNVALQQTADVMSAMKGGKSPMDDPQVQQARQQLMVLMQEEGVLPHQIKELGRLAEMSIYDRRAYAMFLKKLRDFGLADAEDLRGDIDYGALLIFATMAKLV